MTVVLAGIGADTTNVGALGPMYADGTFEYVPIPEKTRATTETQTLGTWAFRYRDDCAASLTNRIHPQPVQDGDVTISGEELEDWPLHHDPNFDALTYGEHRTSGYVSRLRTLEAGDVVGFYAGLRREDDPEARAHRYLIGYMTVNRVDVVTPDLSADDVTAILEAHPENAHTKRAGDGELYLSDKSVVLVDGREPGGLFDADPIRMSEYRVKPGNERAQYYLREELRDDWAIEAGGTNMMYKPAYRCALEGESFVESVGVPGQR
ncbi:hypothetical protein ACLI4R_00450 [Natrialbaceae archaeon A-chndr2]